MSEILFDAVASKELLGVEFVAANNANISELGKCFCGMVAVSNKLNNLLEYLLIFFLKREYSF